MVLSSRFLTFALLVALASSCASTPPKPTKEYTQAQSLIEKAEKDGAQRYAEADLRAAREKLAASRKAAEKGDDEEASQLATEASLDAQVASARTSTGKAKQAAEQATRQQATPPPAPTPSPTPSPPPATAPSPAPPSPGQP
jgi:hypothetical protein